MAGCADYRKSNSPISATSQVMIRAARDKKANGTKQKRQGILRNTLACQPSAIRDRKP
jgi:hypothetical protein